MWLTWLLNKRTLKITKLMNCRNFLLTKTFTCIEIIRRERDKNWGECEHCILLHLAYGIVNKYGYGKLKWFKQMQGRGVASWLEHSNLEQAVQVWVLAGDIVLCFWARHLTLTVPLSIQVYKWVPVNLMLGGSPAMTSIPSRGGEILLVTSCYWKRDKLWPDGPLGSDEDF